MKYLQEASLDDHVFDNLEYIYQSNRYSKIDGS